VQRGETVAPQVQAAVHHNTCPAMSSSERRCPGTSARRPEGLAVREHRHGEPFAATSSDRVALCEPFPVDQLPGPRHRQAADSAVVILDRKMYRWTVHEVIEMPVLMAYVPSTPNGVRSHSVSMSLSGSDA
jgi:hypothetical protein